MFFRKIVLALAFLAVVATPVFAETVIDLDIVADTTWTKAMSPIIIKSNARNDRIRWVASGAVLTIEPGVEVRIDSGMSLQVASQCLRSYGTDACYRDNEGNIKMPKLIAHGTSTEPIIFTSSKSDPQPGDWGALVVEAPNSELEWVEVRYAGAKGKRAAVEVNNSLFKDNLVEKSGSAAYALYVSSQKIEGSVIRDNLGIGIFCDHECDIIDSVIERNAGDAIEVDLGVPATFTGNLIFDNGGNGIASESIYSQDATIENNFFRENSGGVYFHRSNEGLDIKNNNFLKNKNFAIKSDINNREGQIYPAVGNWFGIDTGPKSVTGQFLVSSDYDASEFSASDVAFAIEGSSKAAREYREYLAENNMTGNFFSGKVERAAIIGSENSPGALLKYSVTLENKTTSARDAKLAVSIPADQNLLLCSAQPATAAFDYSLATACTTTVSSELAFKNNQLVWSPIGIPALDEKTLFFVMMTKPTTTNPSLPRLDFASKPFSYTLGTAVELNESGGGSASSTASTPESSTATAATTTTTTTTTTTQVATPVVSTDGSLATGTVSRQIINGILNYVLTTADGKNYILYNSYKWREIDDFTKSADKGKRIAVYGDFYINRYGVASGIKFTRFDVID
ncbi:MAG: right-handed parallel beta-helix repeat-containing protein [Candidatus Peribacteraceae bacterium]|nr:right-handed parallel beta-helix repeat-containing protein [Candidatus Peribacteraceae bacterium]